MHFLFTIKLFGHGLYTRENSFLNENWVYIAQNKRLGWKIERMFADANVFGLVFCSQCEVATESFCSGV